MKFLLLLCILVFSFNIKAQTAEVVMKDFFTALSAKDVETLDRLTLDEMQLHSLAIYDTVVLSSTSKNQFIESFKNIPENIIIEERIFDIKSLVSDHLAQFEVPYEFYVNAKLSHTGTNVLTLVKNQDGWKISYIADTRIK